MPLEGSDYFIYVLQLPDGVPGAIRLNSDNTYSIYINPIYDKNQQIETYTHELWHIIHDDLYGEKSIESLEPQLRNAS